MRKYLNKNFLIISALAVALIWSFGSLSKERTVKSELKGVENAVSVFVINPELESINIGERYNSAEEFEFFMSLLEGVALTDKRAVSISKGNAIMTGHIFSVYFMDENGSRQDFKLHISDEGAVYIGRHQYSYNCSQDLWGFMESLFE